MTRAISNTLKGHYALGTTTVAQCWKATLRDGSVIAATTHTDKLVIDGVTYLPTQAYNPSDIEGSSDLNPDNLEVDGFLASPAITADDIRSGRWDYAQIELFEVNYTDLTVGRNLVRKGTLGRVKAGRSIFTAELRGLTQAYSRRIVTLTTQECQNDLGDSRCGVNLAPWTIAATVAHVDDNKIIRVNSRTEPTDWFTGGKLTFTSGLNNGRSMEVKSYTLSSGVGIFELFEQMPSPITAADMPGTPFPPANGGTPAPAVPDAFTVYAGCQKRFYEDCKGKFNNVVGPASGQGFRGFPHLPGVGVFGGPGTTMTPTPVIAHSPAPSPGSPPPPQPPSPGPAPGTPPPSPGSGTGNYLFGSRLVAYAAGIKPTDTNANMDAFIQQQYNSWVANLLKTTVSGIGSVPAGGYWVQFSDPAYLTVSEGMGYGMLICVIMAGYDPTAQTKFNGLLSTVRAFRSGNYGGVLNMTELMSWRVAANGTDAGSAWPALDGDLDIALALLMADYQWGSGGTWNYRSIALAMIAQIKPYAFSSGGAIVSTSGVTHDGRTSDYMFNHFRAFKRYTGDSFWDNAVSEQKRIVDYMQRTYAPATGLLPDWVGDADTATPHLTTSVVDGGNQHEDGYWYNACRDPWRFGTDFVMTADADMKTFVTRMETFFQSATGGNVTNIINGYALNGTGLVAPNPYSIDPPFYCPMMVGATCDARFQSWLDALWTYTKAHPQYGYYNTELQLLAAIVVSGNWWTP